MQPLPGDLAGTSAEGWLGRLIRHGTGSNIGHTVVMVRPTRDPDVWVTHEALGRRDNHGRDGVQVTTRHLSTIVELVTIARTDAEARCIVRRSEACVALNRGYDRLELVRIACWMLANAARVVHLRPVAWLLDRAGEWAYSRSDEDERICSHHVYLSVLAGRPELAQLTRHPASRIWPGELMRVLRAQKRLDEETIHNN